MTFEEIVNEVRPLAQKLLESKDEEMKGDALLLKSFIFLFVGMADQINEEQRAELTKIISIHAAAMWFAVERFRTFEAEEQPSFRDLLENMRRKYDA